MRTPFAWVLSALICLSAGTAFAQEGAGEAQEAPPSATPYAQKIRSAIQKLVGRDVMGAQADLRAAIDLDASLPDAHYYLALAYRRANQNDDALNEYRACVERATAANMPWWQARGLLGRADLLEELPGRLGEARDAWTELMHFSQSNPGIVPPENPRARVTAIDRAAEQERVYMEVRQRIAEREGERQREEAERAQRERTNAQRRRHLQN